MSYRMTEEMQYRLGYDKFGNNDNLLCVADMEALEAGLPRRVAGDAVCPCGSASIGYTRRYKAPCG